MYESVIYFRGPKTMWAGKVSEDEVIARRESKYLWFARSYARELHGSLDPTRCGYIVLKDSEVLEHVEATT